MDTKLGTEDKTEKTRTEKRVSGYSLSPGTPHDAPPYTSSSLALTPLNRDTSFLDQQHRVS